MPVQGIFGSDRNEAEFTNALPTPTRTTSVADTVDEVTSGVAGLGISTAPASGARSAPVTKGNKRDVRSLYAPLLLMEYKKPDDKASVPDAGVNQGRLYTVAASQFFAHLGILDFPTFGLITDGALGATTCTYTTAGGKQPSKEVTYVAEANGQIFDLSSPLGAFHFCTFLCMILTRHATALGSRLNAVKDQFQERCRRQNPDEPWNPDLVWNKVMQDDIHKARSQAAGSIAANTEGDVELSSGPGSSSDSTSQPV